MRMGRAPLCASVLAAAGVAGTHSVPRSFTTARPLVAIVGPADVIALAPKDLSVDYFVVGATGSDLEAQQDSRDGLKGTHKKPNRAAIHSQYHLRIESVDSSYFV